MEQVINREDMLELTRRLTSKRTNLVRIAGAYMDDEGYIDGTFNTSFLSLKGAEKERCLAIAKEVLISGTNSELKSHKIPGMLPGSIWQLLYAIRDCELKNDALLLNLYEIIAEQYPKGREYAIYIYYGVYDVPVKASDKERLEDSEEVYSYIIAAIAPTDADQVPELPNAGFLYPAFTDRSTDMEHINVFRESSLRFS
jgi:hypothetical protein